MKRMAPPWPPFLAGVAALAVLGGTAAPPSTPAAPLPAKASPAFSTPELRVPFGPGERLDFAVKFGFVRAGSATLEVTDLEQVDGETVLNLLSTATSSSFFNSFYPVDNRYTSTWSLDRHVPLRFTRRVREGSYRLDETVRFDHERDTAIYQNGQRHDILPGSQDVLSAFYYVRGVSLRIGDTLKIPNHSNGKSYTLHVRVLRREQIEVPAGKFRCVVIEPKLESDGVFQQKGTLTVWLSDDARRIPVLMKSKIKVGSIVAELERYRVGTPVRELFLKGDE